MENSKLLEVDHLSVHFHTERGEVTAVQDISFHVEKGEILGVVGESGCGKSVTSQAVLRLFDEKDLVRYDGEIRLQGRDLLKNPMSEMNHIRGNEISMIFQDPSSSINPLYTIGYQVAEALILHQNVSKKEAMERAVELLRLTGIPSPEKRIHEYPHEISGGMKQRVMIAIALACEPKLLIADEPTTALDVTIQAQILDLMLKLNKKMDMGIMMITHDLGVVAEICTRVVVMYLGQIVEEADVESLFNRPLHPYTRGLMKSIPHMEGEKKEELYVISGSVPSLNNVPKGCRFTPRCPYADSTCHSKNPELLADNQTQKVRCWHYKDISEEEGELVYGNR
ncbi:ABC transporter ATP-binding protein [Mesobacillus maritimus]|uniref:ABC transporter ATP-binding protein n=1 Tax=Mesobacillus maritimus TaxID=1643336 RepID=UPI00384CD997